ncbi:Dynein heavy chain [Giardia lamblia P15]|uniref:Dynein heavy chain n=1 Tax=Giardia intestinalis (strain P15) TaxID=658858 RepID=E1EX20_GIAIA|nr:Dynein heavy chain [Giardia lamblia P15]
MVPDREIIIRVKLASAGFMKSSMLAKKFFILYQLCEEQLSKQRHYDFGLRNILSVLRICGSRRRSNPDLSEENILLRVLTDMNRSKLVDEDAPLFMSLTEDLFPGLRVEDNSYPDLDAALSVVCGELFLQQHPDWLKAVVQFYETHLVRHGIMLLGPPLSGKSQSILSLAKAMSAMNPSTTFPKKYTVIKMNPKAITAPQMFGRLDAATGDWTDGIFSSIWRRCTKREGEWFFFCLNGPVDAVWIENLNTVLDDNKTLTLANSDRIPMSNTLKLVFEVDSLANASPATVSRAGMIYMSHWILGWRPVLESWVASWPEATSSVIKRMFTDANFLDDLYALIDTAVLHPVTTLPRLQLFRSLMMVLTSLIYFGSGVDGLSESELIEVNESIVNALSTASHITSEGFTNATQAQTQSIATNAAAFASKYSETHLKRMVTFAVMWSFGAVLDLEERTRTFQKFLYDKKVVLDLPTLDASNPNDNVFNYFVDDTGNWRLWAEVVPKCEYPPKTETPFANILIPTIDNTSLDMVLRKVSYSQFNIMLIGESGSGKTVDILTFLNNQDKEKYAIRNINFSSATTAHLLQDNVEAFVEKRMGLSYGPVAGKKGLVFIDEVNIPQINEWGDQPTNELTRQLIEERGFYALDKPGEFHIMQDMTFLAAAPLPGGGRNDIPTRLKGHFITINVGLPASDQLDMIFGTIVKGHYQESREFSEDVCNIAARLVMTTRKLWQATKARMLPTPAKFHYIFNLRDLSRITQGFINSQPDVIDSARKLVYLWANECTRVLPDKFTTLEDITWFNNAIVQFAAEDLGDALAAEVEVFAAQNNIITVPQFAKDEEGNEKRIYFVDFMRDPPEDVPEGADDDAYEAPKIYEPVMDREVLLERIRGFQQKYNELNRRSPLDLVFFDACVAHILRISRIIRMPRGHCLLVGVGGSGKQSCTKLASSIAGYTTFQITITRGYNISNFDEDLRTLYKMAGVENKGVTFMFTDADVKEEVFLERINNILTSGEIPALFAKDEVENITNDCRPGFKKEKPREPDTNENLWNFFLDRVKANLHVVLCFSPVGPKFRERARKFPGLISGCTTDWFQPWPRQALCDVAIKNLTGFEIRTKEGDSDVLGKLVEHIAQVHLSMTDVTKSYFDRFRRQTYVTPKSYLSFLSSFKSLYLEKLVDLKEQHRRLKTGLDKLETAAADVSKMRVDLEAKEKDLAVAQTKANEMMKVISVSTAEAEKTKKEVQTVADELAIQADEIAKQKAEAEEGLAKALPALEKAEKALEAIEPNDINTLKKLAKPPHLIQRIMDTVLLLMNMPLDRVTPDPEFPIDKKILKPSWKNSLLLMNQAGFLRSLLEFERDGITDETCELLEAYLEMSDFNIEAARKSSGNAAGLLQWSQAMYEYHFIALEVEPKRAAVREAESNFKAAMASLTSAKEDLAEKQAALNKLQEQYDEAVNEKKRLQDEADLTGRRLHAASALINGLSGERKRWSQQARELDDAAVRLVGDASLSSAFLSYAGPFNQEYRQFLVTQIWLKDLEERRLPFTRGIENEIHNFLVSEATVGEWRLQGLPTDQLSTENGIIVTTSTRYPLMIDPQTQAAAWIKNMYSDLKVTTFSNKYFRQMVEDALNMGQPLLIEDVEEELDPLLDPILEKQFVKTGKSLKVKLGDKECEVCDGFKLFITSKLPNPRYLPETYAKTSVIDFSVTFSGLEAQLLARTVNIERKELEDQRRELLEEVNANKKQMAKLEEDLLSRLSATQGNLLDDVELVDVLNKTKETTEGVKEKLASAVETERKINEAREEFMVVATRGSIIYFLVTEMSTVNSMYQTSLKQFLELFDQSIYDAEPSPITTKRIANVIQNMTIKIFRYIARGLYERDKLLFILQLCLKIDLKAGNVSQLEFGTFIRGGAALDLSNVRAKPAAWIPDKAWLNIIALSALNTFTSLPNQIAENEHAWRQWYDSEAPENIDLPPEYNGRISVFQKLLLVRCLREDRTMLAVNEYIIHSLGAEFAEPVPVNFEDIFMNEAKQQVPITFLLSLGSDPTSQIEAVAKKLKIEMRFISMGQGQEPQARRLIIEGIANGTWVMISNSHLGLKFMSEIELMIMDLTEKMASVTESSGKDDGAGDAVAEGGTDKGGDSAENQGTGGIFSMLGKGQLPHSNFRLILTTDPHPQFPIGLLQKTLKLTNDPASGCRASLKRTYQTLTQDYLETCDKPQWLPLVYCIAFIHTTLIERKKFGSLGWCIPYEFSLPDFTASVQFLQNYLYGLDSVVKGAAQKGSLISYSTIRYMIAEVHYGGRVTDDFDRRLLKTYCEEWLSARSLTPEFEFSRGYHIPKHNNITEARTYIDGLPFVDKPQIYGLHSNADILFRNKQAGEILSTIVNMQPKDSGGGGGSKDGKQQVVLTREEQVLKLARDMLTKLPPDYDTKVTVKQQIQKQGGKAKPLNVFLGQEIDRMQVVLSLIRTTLADLQLAIAGTIIMNEALQDSLDSLYDARVPSRWLNVSWPASTLGFWLSDVTNRCTQFTDWLTKGRPNSYWLSGYFNPQGFLTSVKQEITRMHTGWALDRVYPRTNVSKFSEKGQVNQPPEEGVYIHGLFLDAAAWDKKNNRLIDQPPKVLFVPLPLLHLDATNDVYTYPTKMYDCPLYKTPARTGLNYIFTIKLPTDANPNKWVLRGTALLCNIQ